MKIRVLLMCVTLISLLQFGDSNPVNLEYESNSVELLNSSSQIYDSLDSEEVTERAKRQISPELDNYNTTVNSSIEEFVNLSDVIRRIETVFLKSASNILQAFGNLNLDDSDSDDDYDNVRNPSSIYIHQTHKRAISEDMIESTSTPAQPEDTPSTQEIPKVISMNRISIYPSTGYFPILPSFDYHIVQREIREVSEDELKKLDVANEVKMKGITENGDVTSVIPSTIQPLATAATQGTTTIQGKSLAEVQTTQTLPTTKDSIKHLEDVENDIKEKVAETEAKPIKLSSKTC